MKKQMKNMTMTEKQLLFIEHIRDSQGILFRISAVYATEEASRKDLRQNILLQLWRSYATFRDQSLFSTWMYRVALNTAMMYQRKQKNHLLTVPIEDVPQLTSEINPIADSDDVQLLYRCIQELPKLDRAVILLKLEQKSYQEISDVTGISESNVSVRLVRIKQKLRTLLEEKGYKGNNDE